MKITCDLVPQADYIEIGTDGGEMTVVTVTNMRDKGTPGDGLSPQVASVYLDDPRELVHALGGVTRRDLEVWADNNSADHVTEFILESGYFPKPEPPCEHDDIKLDSDQWSPVYESLHGSCEKCGVAVRYEIGNDSFEVTE